MGTAREPVTGSGVWPAWTARVANCCFDSDMVGSLIGGWSGSGFGLWMRIGQVAGCPKKQNGPNPLRTRAAWFQDRLRLAHSPLKSRTDRSAAHAHAHGHDHNSVIS